MIVVDASVLAPALADDGPDGDRARERLRARRLVAPSLVDLEVTSVLRGAVAAGRLPDRRAQQALDDLVALPLERAPRTPLLGRIWELREHVTAYDAAYVALAEAIGTTLVTTDGRLCRASGVRCAIELVG